MGRHTERQVAARLLADAHDGRSGVLVVRGQAGIGKTALMEFVRESAVLEGFRVESALGVRSEAEFAFAGLQQMCGPMLEHLDSLPDPQQAALSVVLGLSDGTAPDRFLVGLAALNLLAEVSEKGPLVCLVDDAQWLDQASAQVLAFVARRVEAERVVVVFALRDPIPDDSHPFTGFPELRLEGLGETDARTLLNAAVRSPLDDEVRDRIIAEARGNPLALMELPRSAQPEQLAGGFELPDVLSVPRRIEESFQRRSENLPADTQLLLLAAAADPTGDVALLWGAAEHLGMAREVAAPAEAAGLMEIDTSVRFRHPLARSAVYRAATPSDRRRAHLALAAATDPHDPDRRAWHRAQAVLGTDEGVAADLELSAGRARARGGLAARAAFLQHAAELTPEPGSRASRALEAAHAKLEAGSFEAAVELLAMAEVGPLQDLQRARLELLRAEIAFHLTRGSELPRVILRAAATLSPLDAALSRETYLRALDAAVLVGGLGPDRGVLEVARAAREAPAAADPPRPVDLLLDGLVTTFTRGYAAGVPELRRALEAFGDADPHLDDAVESRRWLWLAGRTAVAIFDDEMVYKLA